MLDVYRPCTGAPIVPTVTQLARAHTDCGSAGWPVIKSQLFFAIPTMFQLMVTLRKQGQRSHTSNVAMMPLYLTVDS